MKTSEGPDPTARPLIRSTTVVRLRRPGTTRRRWRRRCRCPAACKGLVDGGEEILSALFLHGEPVELVGGVGLDDHRPAGVVGVTLVTDKVGDHTVDVAGLERQVQRTDVVERNDLDTVRRVVLKPDSPVVPDWTATAPRSARVEALLSSETRRLLALEVRLGEVDVLFALGSDGDRCSRNVAVASLVGEAARDRVPARRRNGETKTEISGDGTHEFDVEAGEPALCIRIFEFHRRVRNVSADGQRARADEAERIVVTVITARGGEETDREKQRKKLQKSLGHGVFLQKSCTAEAGQRKW